MNLSSKDKKIMIFLGCAVAFILGYTFIYRTQADEIKRLQGIASKYLETSRVNDEVKAKVLGLDSEIPKMNTKLSEVRSQYPPALDYDSVIMSVKEIAVKAGINVDNLNFSKPMGVSTAVQASPKPGETEKKDNDQQAAIQEIPLTDSKIKELVDSLGISKPSNETMSVEEGKSFAMEVTLRSSGTIEQLNQFSEGLKGVRNKIVIKNIQIVGAQDGKLSFNLILNYLGIKDSQAAKKQNYVDIKWQPTEIVPRDNIFAQGGALPQPGATVAPVTDTTAQATTTPSVDISKYDFTMRAMQFSSGIGPPSVSLSAENLVPNDKVRKTMTVNGDNQKSERCEISLEEKKGKFYCKFKTQHETFPEGYKTTAEFVPVGNDIMIYVNGNKRASNKDLSTAIIKVRNSTTRNVIVEVKEEDPKQPRIKIEKSGKNIIVK